ncbi:MAG TPA: amidohydrolase family protein, partial [Gemmata sp.]|nr:amidohydrolase family protein [Gemmata sp.]
QLKAFSDKARGRMVLPELTREYTLNEIAIITSAGPARTLGLTQKGHLGIGADADVAIYNENKDIAQMFSYPRYVIKSGEIIVEEGELRKSVQGRAFAVRPEYDESIEDYIRPLFQQYYTMSFENYPVTPERVHGLQVVDRRS